MDFHRSETISIVFFFFGISKGISLATFPIPSFLADFFRENCGFLHTCPGRFKFSGRIRKLEKWIRIFVF